MGEKDFFFLLLGAIGIELFFSLSLPFLRCEAEQVKRVLLGR